VNTPTASIGIRGGTGIFDVQGGRTRSINIFGQQNVSSATCAARPHETAGPCTVSLLRPGAMTDVVGGAAPPTTPIPVPLNILAAYNLEFQARPGQTGGSGGVSPGAVTAQIVKHDVAAAINPGSPGVQDTVQGLIGNKLLADTIIAQATLAAQLGAQTAAADVTAANTIGGPFPAGAFALSMTNCCDPNAPTSAAPYLPAAFAPPGNQVISPVLGYRNISTTPGKPFNGGAVLQYGVNITGTSASQSSWFFVSTARFNTDSTGAPVISGGFVGTNRLSATAGMGVAAGPVTSIAGGVLLNASGIPISYSVNANNFSPETGKILPDNAFVHPAGQADAAYQFRQNATAMPTPAGLGSNRPDAVLFGFTGGLMQTRNTTTNVSSSPYAVVGANAMVLDSSTSSLVAVMGVQNTNTSATNQLNTGTFVFGAADPARFRSAYIDYDHFGAREAVTVVDAASNTTAPISQVNGQNLTSHAAAMVNITAGDAQSIAANLGNNVTFCQCDFTRWGFWSTDSTRTDPNTGQTLVDSGHMMPWVSGQLTDPSLMPSTGTATYNGHVIVNVSNAGAQYINAANFSNTVNFASRSGNVTVAPMDGTGYAGSVSWSQGSPFFSGTAAGTNTPLGRTMTLNGAFFRGASGPAGEMGGSVNISGTGYLASGIFAARH
jgi:hypothetical protein